MVSSMNSATLRSSSMHPGHLATEGEGRVEVSVEVKPEHRVDRLHGTAQQWDRYPLDHSAHDQPEAD